MFAVEGYECFIYQEHTKKSQDNIYIYFFFFLEITLYGTLGIKISSVSRWFNLFEPYN